MRNTPSPPLLSCKIYRPLLYLFLPPPSLPFPDNVESDFSRTAPSFPSFLSSSFLPRFKGLFITDDENLLLSLTHNFPHTAGSWDHLGTFARRRRRSVGLLKMLERKVSLTAETIFFTFLCLFSLKSVRSFYFSKMLLQYAILKLLKLTLVPFFGATLPLLPPRPPGCEWSKRGRRKRKEERGKGGRRRRREEEEEGKEGRGKASCMISQGGKTATGGKRKQGSQHLFFGMAPLCWTPFLNISFGGETDLKKGTTTLLFCSQNLGKEKKSPVTLAMAYILKIVFFFKSDFFATSSISSGRSELFG